MISWVDSIIIWSHSIIKLTPAQFKILICFFPPNFFSSHLRTGCWPEGPGAETGHRLLWHHFPSPPEPGASSTRSEGVGRGDVEKRANSLYLAGLGQCSLLVGCMYFGDGHKWAVVFFYMAQVQTLAGCEHMSFFRGLGRDSHCTVPSCLQFSSCPSAYTALPTPASATFGLPTDPRGWSLLTAWAAHSQPGKPEDWLKLS